MGIQEINFKKEERIGRFIEIFSETSKQLYYKLKFFQFEESIYNFTKKIKYINKLNMCMIL